VVFCTDAAVAGVHCDLDLVGPADLGWRASVATISDLAAMGADPWCLVVSVATPPDIATSEVMVGAIEAARLHGCPVVGGDLTSSPTAMVSVAALGTVPMGQAVTRSGARPGDAIVLTGPVGGSAAGLEALRRQLVDDENVARHRRPVARLAMGQVARRFAASAMIDVSDGLSLDLHRLADASGVGFVIEGFPVAAGATRAQALGGGEDYELVITVADAEALAMAFVDEGLSAPSVIGTIVADPAVRMVDGVEDQPIGWSHDVS
jgi:thiamine-monophosphate kinase